MGLYHVAVTYCFLHLVLHCWCLGIPDGRESLLRPQGEDPHVQTQDDREEGVDDNQIARNLQPATSGHGNGGECKCESGEYHYGINDASYSQVSPNSAIKHRRLGLLERRLSPAIVTE